MSYVPSPNLEFDSWIENFVEQLEADPPAYGFTPAELIPLREAYDVWAALFALTENPVTRTSVVIADRVTAREVLEELARRFAMLVQVRFSTTDGQRQTLGITVPAGHSPPITPEGTPPVITVQVVGPASVILRYQNPETPNSFARPHGSHGMEYALGLAETPVIVPVLETNSLGMIGVHIKVLNISSHSPQGKFGTFYGRWLYSAGGHGPWSQAVSAAFNMMT